MYLDGIPMYESVLALEQTTLPNKVHIAKRWMRVKVYHKRIQKKWIRRWGYYKKPCCFKGELK